MSKIIVKLTQYISSSSTFVSFALTPIAHHFSCFTVKVKLGLNPDDGFRKMFCFVLILAN